MITRKPSRGNTEEERCGGSAFDGAQLAEAAALEVVEAVRDEVVVLVDHMAVDQHAQLRDAVAQRKRLRKILLVRIARVRDRVGDLLREVPVLRDGGRQQAAFGQQLRPEFAGAGHLVFFAQAVGQAEPDRLMLDEKRVLPCTAYLEGEYGIDGLYMGVPVKLGRNGIEQVLEVDLDEGEREALARSADAVRDVVGVLTP